VAKTPCLLEPVGRWRAPLLRLGLAHGLLRLDFDGACTMRAVASIHCFAVLLLLGCGGVGVDADGVVAHVRSEGATGHCAGVSDLGTSDAEDGTPIDCGVELENHCSLAVPGASPSDRPLTARADAFTAAVSVLPADDGIDGVVGIAAGAAASLDDLALAVRFNGDGSIDARDGDGFHAVTPQNYAARSAYRVLFVVDAARRAYSAWVNGRLIARNFAFHGAPGAALDRMTTWVSSETGALRACGFASSADDRLLWLRHAEPDAAAIPSRALTGLASGELLATSQSDTELFDPKGNLVETFAHGARALLLDADENRYLFGEFSGVYDGGDGGVPSKGGTDVYVSKYDRSFRHVYTRTLGSTTDDELSAYDVNASGSVVVLAGRTLFRLDDAGRLAWTRSIDAEHATVALDDAGRTYVAAAGAAPGVFTISAFAANDSQIWTRTGTATEPGMASVLALRSTKDGGIVASGAVSGTLELGGAVLGATRGDAAETFVAWLDGAGNYRAGAVLELVPNDRLAVDETNTVTLGGNRTNPDVFVLERLAFDGNTVDVAELGGHELLRGLFLGTALAPSVDRHGNAYWFVAPRIVPGASASFLLKLNPEG
jgi:hypothetical protein